MQRTNGLRLLLAAAAVLGPPLLGCTGFTFTPDQGSTTAIEGLSHVGDAVEFELPLTGVDASQIVTLSASRSCGEGVLELVLDGDSADVTSGTATVVSTDRHGGHTLTGTILVVRAPSGAQETLCTPSADGSIQRSAQIQTRTTAHGCGAPRVTSGQGI